MMDGIRTHQHLHRRSDKRGEEEERRALTTQRFLLLAKIHSYCFIRLVYFFVDLFAEICRQTRTAFRLSAVDLQCSEFREDLGILYHQWLWLGSSHNRELEKEGAGEICSLQELKQRVSSNDGEDGTNEKRATTAASKRTATRTSHCVRMPVRVRADGWCAATAADGHWNVATCLGGGCIET